MTVPPCSPPVRISKTLLERPLAALATREDSDAQVVAAAPVLPIRSETEYPVTPNAVPLMLETRLSFGTRLEALEPSTEAESTDTKEVDEPWTTPTVTRVPLLSLPAPPARHRSAESDIHPVPAESVHPKRPLALYAVRPKPAPSMLVLIPPVEP